MFVPVEGSIGYCGLPPEYKFPDSKYEDLTAG